MKSAILRQPVDHRSAARARRRGFTLVELLMVIAILSILIALLLPAIFRGNITVRIQQVKTEITALDTAIKSFKQEFGVEPPSRIVLCEQLSDWNLNPLGQATIARIWPQFDFSLPRDLNGDGDTTDIITLSGPECLVMFLGGTLDASGQPSGFSRVPANPWTASGTNRVGPFYQFMKDRLIVTQTAGSVIVAYAYADPISGTQVPYLYASSNEGQGYNEDAPATQVAVDLVSTNIKDARGDLATAYIPHYYRQGTNISAVPSTSPFWNKNSYQIISAGFDRRFGGPSTGGTGPFHLGGDWQKGADLTGTRDSERDNITNFSDGLLVP